MGQTAVTVRVAGTVALTAGMITALLNAITSAQFSSFYILAGLLVATGLGLRIEAAVRQLSMQLYGPDGRGSSQDADKVSPLKG
jgi:hypothetical protein